MELHTVYVSPCCMVCSIMLLLPTIKSTQARDAELALLVPHFPLNWGRKFKPRDALEHEQTSEEEKNVLQETDWNISVSTRTAFVKVCRG